MSVETILPIAIFVLGAVAGSFVGALSFRMPRGKSIKKGRSLCPACGKAISGYDNIPIISYFLLGGKCRNCKKKISFRYPFIEASTGILFYFSYLLFVNCRDFRLGNILGDNICQIQGFSYYLFAIFGLMIVVSLITIFVIDYENKIIPDELVFTIFSLAFAILIVTSNQDIYKYLLSGFVASSFLLLIHLITLGKGMGLGDVKLAIPMGMILGWPYTLIWMMASFVIGAVVGVLLMFAGKTEFGKQIPFGPFLIISFFLIIFVGNRLLFLFPFLLH